MGAAHREATRLARTLPRTSLCIVLMATPYAARADAGVPMLALVWPASWMLFIPIVAIEAWIARKVVGLTVKRCILASTAANAVSTLVGIPLVWGGASRSSRSSSRTADRRLASTRSGTASMP
jgi:hypothetical protein